VTRLTRCVCACAQDGNSRSVVSVAGAPKPLEVSQYRTANFKDQPSIERCVLCERQHPLACLCNAAHKPATAPGDV
jgi:hypothetical protein